MTLDAGSSTANRLIISDYAQTTAAKTNVIQTAVVIGGVTYQQLQNFASTGHGPTINYVATGGGFNDIVGATDRADGILLNGSHTLATTFTLRTTVAGSTLMAQGGLANDNFFIGAPPPTVTILPGNPADKGNLDLIQGHVTVLGNGGADTLEADDHADGDANDSSGFNYLVTPTAISNDPTVLLTVPTPTTPPARTFAGISYNNTATTADTVTAMRLDATDRINIFSVTPSKIATYSIFANKPVSGAPIKGGGDYPDARHDEARQRHRRAGIAHRFRRHRLLGVQRRLQDRQFQQHRTLQPRRGRGHHGLRRPQQCARDYRPRRRDQRNSLQAHGLRADLPRRRQRRFRRRQLRRHSRSHRLFARARVRASTIKIYNGTPNIYGKYAGTLLTAFNAFAPNFIGGVNLATGDVNGDGAVDLIVAPAAGMKNPVIEVFNGLTLRTTHALLGKAFPAFESGFYGGINVAAGDLGKNGYDDIVATRSGGVPTVNIFNGMGYGLLETFNAFDPNFKGGVTVAVGDYNGDNQPDIIVSQWVGGLPEVIVYNGTSLFKPQPPSILTTFLLKPRHV